MCQHAVDMQYVNVNMQYVLNANMQYASMQYANIQHAMTTLVLVSSEIIHTTICIWRQVFLRGIAKIAKFTCRFQYLH